MEPEETVAVPRTGMNDTELAERPTVFAEELFRNKVVLISGGGSGIGRATAILFARLGATLVLCGRDESKLGSAAAFLSGLGATAATEAMTIRDPEQVNGLFARLSETHGGIDILVNNAGGQFAQETIDISPKGWNAVVDTNLNGTFYMMQAAAKAWQKAERPGSIVNVVAAIWRGMPQVAHTCAARAGVVFLSKSVATEWAPLKIRVNCVAPGTIVTEGFGNYSPAARATFSQANPMLRSGHPWDIAEAIAYLSSGAANFITGETFNVDGGSQNWGDPWFLGRPEHFELDYAVSKMPQGAKTAVRTFDE
jgi:citronellol/citronellal dehydrogenase